MNKKEIRIDLLPEDFIGTFNNLFVIRRALRREFPNALISAWSDEVYIHGNGARKFYSIKNSFEMTDFNFVKSQYEKGTKTRYYITLIPQ